MGLPEKGYFTLDELVKRWGTDLGNLKYYTEQNLLEIQVWLGRNELKVYELQETGNGYQIWKQAGLLNYKGFVILHPDEVRKVFRFTECIINKFTSLDRKQSYRIVDGQVKYMINVTDMVVTKAE